MKTVTIVTTYNVGAPLNRIISIVNALRAYEVRLVIPMQRSQLMQYNSLSNSAVHVQSVEPFISRRKNFVLRFIEEIRFSYTCVRVARKLKSDYTIISIPFSSLLITAKIANIQGVMIADIRDLVWEYLDTNNSFKRLIKYVFKGIHIFFLRKYDKVVVTNPTEHKLLSKVRKNIEIIPNGIAEVPFNKITNSIEPVLNKTKPFIITYIGNVGLLQNLSIIIHAVSIFPDIQLKIIGDGNDLQNLKYLIEANNIKNVALIGRVEGDELIKYYNETTMLFASLDPKITTAVPSKLYEYLATGKPIMYCGVGAAVDILDDFENTFISNYSLDELKETLETLPRRISKAEFSFNNIEKIRHQYLRESLNQKFVTLLD